MCLFSSRDFKFFSLVFSYLMTRYLGSLCVNLASDLLSFLDLWIYVLPTNLEICGHCFFHNFLPHSLSPLFFCTYNYTNVRLHDIVPQTYGFVHFFFSLFFPVLQYNFNWFIFKFSLILSSTVGNLLLNLSGELFISDIINFFKSQLSVTFTCFFTSIIAVCWTLWMLHCWGSGLYCLTSQWVLFWRAINIQVDQAHTVETWFWALLCEI